MSFRDFMDNKRFNKQEQIKKDELRMNAAKKTVRSSQMSTQRRRRVEQRDAYAESQEMLETLNEKLQQVLYRFGMAGLEQVDRAIIETCREMMNPGQSQPRTTKKRSAVSETSAPQRQQQQQPASFIDIAAAAVQKMPPMGDMNDHVPLPPKTESAEFNSAPVMQGQPIPVSQPDAGAEYYDNLDPSTLSPDELEAMLNGKNGVDAGVTMNMETLSNLGKALKKGK